MYTPGRVLDVLSTEDFAPHARKLCGRKESSNMMSAPWSWQDDELCPGAQRIMPLQRESIKKPGSPSALG
jgi:hypothetical protein